MLFTEIFEKQDKLPSVGGIHPDSLLDPVRARMKQAHYFVLDEQAIAMAVNVSQQKPSSIIACLPFVKLPAPVMWIEFSNQHLRQSMAAMGSPNIRGERHIADVERTGFLLWEEDGQIIMDHVHRDRLQGGITTVLVSNVRLAFDPDTSSRRHELVSSMSHLIDKMSDTGEPEEMDDVGITGKIAKRLKEVNKNDAEAIAMKQLSWRFGMQPHPDQKAFRSAMLKIMSEQKVALMEADQMEDAFRLFVNLILPGLILLNCRNAVRTEVVPAPERLNKQRSKKGKPPIPEYQFVKMHLTPRKKRIYDRQGLSTKSTTGGIVLGHFKVRKTGVFWWDDHYRGEYNGSASRKIYVMTP